MSRAVLGGVLACMLVLAGCTSLAKLGELSADLESAGYDTTGVNHNTTNGVDTLSIEATMPRGEPTDEDADRIAEIVWTKYPAEVDELLITINGRPMLHTNADELTDRLGERPTDLGASSGDDGGTNVVVIVVAVVVALLLAGLVVFIWWRGRKPPPPVAPPPTYQYPPRH